MFSMIFGLKRRIFLKLLLFAIFLATPIIGLEGATYYVSTTGSDWNPGTLASPWRTLAKAVSSVSSGDTVYFRSGTWTDERLYFHYEGYTSRTTFARYPDDPVGSVIFDCTNITPLPYQDGAVYIEGTDYITIDGIKARNCEKGGICGISGADHLEIINCITETTGSSGIYLWGCDDCDVQYNKIYYACMLSIGNGMNEPISIADASTNIDVSYNEAYAGNRPTNAIGGEGINVKDGCSYVYVHHNLSDMARPDGQENDRICMGVDGWTRGAHHIYFYNNILKNGSWGLVFNSEEGGSVHDVYAWNNIIIHCGHSSNMHGGGFGYCQWGGSPGPVDYSAFWNNTVYDCYYGAYFHKEELGTGENYVQNNIIYGSDQADIFWGASNAGDVTLDHNLLGTDPKFVNASGENFHLQSDSPAIDAGIAVSGVTDDFDGIVRPQGAGYDIGAYEYNGINPSLRAIASGNPTSGQAPLTVNFSGSASGGTPPYTYNWTFGDGGSSTAQNPSHTYSSDNTYTATLTVTDNNSETDSDTVTITVDSVTTVMLSADAETGAPAPGPGGTTNPSPGIYSYSTGSTVSVSSNSYTDYRFSMWTGDISGSSIFSPTTVLTMNSDKSISAFFCSKCGDVNGDLQISPGDAQAAFDIFLQKKANPTACELENADVNGSGTPLIPDVTPADSQMIFNKFLNKGTIGSDCSGASRSASLSTQALDFTDVYLTINDIAVSSGQDILIPIIVESPSEITAFGFDLVFPSDILTFIALERTELTENFDQLDANVLSYQMMNREWSELEPEETLYSEFESILASRIIKSQAVDEPDPDIHATGKRILRVGGYKTDTTQNPSAGVLVILVFRVTGQFEDSISLSVTTTYDDIENATIERGMINHQSKSLITEDKRSERIIKK